MKIKIFLLILFVFSVFTTSHVFAYSQLNQFQAEHQIFDSRNGNEWDAISPGITFNKGVISTTGSSFAVRALDNPGTYNFTIQGTVLWDGTQFRSQIGYTNAPPGTIETIAAQHRYFGFNSTVGFYYNDGAKLNQLVAPNEIENGWYTIMVMMRNVGGKGEAIVSLQKERTAMAKSFLITDMPLANNAALYVTQTDKIKNVRYLANSNDEESLLLPIFENERNEHVPVTMDVYGVRTIAHIPASYDLRNKNKVVVFFHGAGGKANDMWIDSNKNKMIKKLLDQGYVVIASDNTLLQSWGNNQSTIDTENLLNHYKKYLNIEDHPYIYASSMGGIVALNSISHTSIKPKAVFGLDPVTNLLDIYQSGQFTQGIEKAYNFNGSQKFSEATENYNPTSINAELYKDIPFKLWASYDDITVNRINNADSFKERVNAAGGNVEIVNVYGQHGDKSHYDPQAVIDFFNKY